MKNIGINKSLRIGNLPFLLLIPGSALGLGLVLVFGLGGCSHGTCRNQQEDKISAATPLNEGQIQEIEKMKATNQGQRVKVYKFDGSLQCGQGQKIPLDQMKKELGNIQIYQAFNKNDGKMRIQLCGSPTGDCNVFEIDRDHLEKALKLGFKEWVQSE